jgi:hypothetical protein
VQSKIHRKTRELFEAQAKKHEVPDDFDAYAEDRLGLKAFDPDHRKEAIEEQTKSIDDFVGNVLDVITKPSQPPNT